MNNKSFEENIRTKEIIEKEKILKLQNDYEKGIIKEEEMTQEQVANLEKLYIEQIIKLKNDFDKYRNKAIELKRKMLV